MPITTTAPCTTGMFLLLIAVARKLPRPGRPKMTSVIAAPVRMLPNCRPRVVMAGIEELRIACRCSTRHSVHPRARADLTYSLRYSSMSRPRTSRVRIAAYPQPSDTAGRIRPLSDPLSMAGSQCSRTLNSSTISRARKKYGTATPRKENALAARSASEFGKAPPSMPSGTPMTIATTIAAAVSSRVLGVRERSSCATEFWVRYDVPRLPCSSWPTKSAYCRQSGCSSPSCRRRFASCAGVASVPNKMILAGSPGTRWMSRNATIVIPITTGTAAASRRRMYASTSGHGSRMEHEVAVQRRVHSLDRRRHRERAVDVPHRQVHRVLHELHAHLFVEGVALGVIGGEVGLRDHRVDVRVVVVRPVEAGLDRIGIHPDVEQVRIHAVVAERAEIMQAGVERCLRGRERLHGGLGGKADLAKL